MANKRDIISNQNSGFFQDLVLRLKLIFRLIGDRRVNFFLKLLPIAAAIYVISPVDLIPGMVIPVIGALDDAAVIWLGTTLFMSLCPEEVVQEHTEALQKVVSGTWRDAPQTETAAGEIIDAQASEVHEDTQTTEAERSEPGGS
jgi:uncharacterized membrane protein YkvA (DUF1232 family)